MAISYPKREPFHAHKLSRLLFKSCDVQTIGAQAALLVIHVAHTEDAARYSGAVRFWNSQLQEVLGFKSSKQLPAARQAAIEAGWLFYRRKNVRSVGEYWTLVPDRFRHIPDTPIEPVGEIEAIAGVVPPVEQIPDPTRSADGTSHAVNRSANGTNGASNRSANGTSRNRTRSAGGTQSGTSCGTQSGTPSNPLPTPSPKNCFSAKSRISGVGKKPDAYTEEFESHWLLWKPTGRGGKDKKAAFVAWWKAIGRLRDAQIDAVGYLGEKIEEFARSADGKSEFAPLFATWLNNDRWEDEERTAGGQDSDYEDWTGTGQQKAKVSA